MITYDEYELWEPKYYINIHKWAESFPISRIDKEKIYFIKADEDTKELAELYQIRDRYISYSIMKMIDEKELENELHHNPKSE
nr:MAG TPA: hypothetical protein [Caudoviricetes sp.]